MNKSVRSLIIGSVLLCSCKATGNDYAAISIDKPMVEMGTIKFDSTYKIEYVIKNSGKAKLVIDTVSSSCGCSVPNISKKTIHPDDTALIVVNYTPVDSGNFSKSLVIRSNIDSVFTVIRFRGKTYKS